MKAKEAVEYNAKWHSVLPSLPFFHVQHAFGAYFNEKTYAVAMWRRPVARTICGLGYLELRRLAICDAAPKNTASRILAWMTRELKHTRPDIVKFISYQDTSHHRGTIYKAAGWHPVDMKSSPVNWGGHSQTKTAPSRESQTKILVAPKIRWELDVK